MAFGQFILEIEVQAVQYRLTPFAPLLGPASCIQVPFNRFVG